MWSWGVADEIYSDLTAYSTAKKDSDPSSASVDPASKGSGAISTRHLRSPLAFGRREIGLVGRDVDAGGSGYCGTSSIPHQAGGTM